MKRKEYFMTTLLSICISMMMFFACSREYKGTLIPIQDEKTGKWGYSDTLGKSVIAYKWDIASTFSEDMAVIGINGKYGYIDQKGTEVIPLKYDIAEDFSENVALVKDNDKYGFINKAGDEIIPLKYENAKALSGGLAEVELDGKIGVIDTANNIVVAFQYKELQYLIGSWALEELSIETDKNNIYSFNGGFSLNKPENSLLTFEKEDVCNSNISYSDDDIFLNVKSLSFDKNNKWQIDDFVLGQSDNSKNSIIFSGNLKLFPQAEKFNYKLLLQEKDVLIIQVSETVFRPSQTLDLGYVTKSGNIRYNFELKFKRLESLKK